MKYNFDSAKEMLDTLHKDKDLYCPDMGMFAFNYNLDGSIAYYYVQHEEAIELERLSRIDGSYWGAYMGPGGFIADDPSSQFYSPSRESNIDFCEEYYEYQWYDCSDVLNIVGGKHE